MCQNRVLDPSSRKGLPFLFHLNEGGFGGTLSKSMRTAGTHGVRIRVGCLGKKGFPWTSRNHEKIAPGQRYSNVCFFYVKFVSFFFLILHISLLTGLTHPSNSISLFLSRAGVPRLKTNVWLPNWETKKPGRNLKLRFISFEIVPLLLF